MKTKALNKRYPAMLSMACALVATYGYASEEATVNGKNSDAKPAITAQYNAKKRTTVSSANELALHEPVERTVFPVEMVGFDRETIRQLPILKVVSTSSAGGLPKMVIDADILTVLRPGWFSNRPDLVSIETAMLDARDKSTY